MPDLGELAFDSANRVERISTKSHANFSVPAFGFITVTVPHNLGYIPYYKAFYTYGAGKYYQLYAGVDSYDIAGNMVQIDNVYEDTVNFYVDVLSSAAGVVTGTIYYRIYAEQQV